MGKRELKTLEVNGKKVSFVEYSMDDGLTYPSTTFMKVNIPANYEDMFEFIGGYTREVMLTPLKETYQGSDKMTILSTVKNGAVMNIHFIYEKDGEILGYRTSLEPSFLPHIIKSLHKHKDIVGECAVENSLDYMGDEKYGRFLEGYEEPKNQNQTGLMYRGEHILSGEKFVIKGLTKVIDNLNGSFKRIVEEIGIDEMEVHVRNDVGSYLIVTQEWFLKPNGGVFTIWDDIKFEKRKVNPNITDEEIFAEEMEDEMESIHKRMRKHLDLKRQEGLTDDELEEEVIKFKKRVRYDEREELSKREVESLKTHPFTELFDRESLNTLMSLPNITVTKL